ncbi:hypothetical protein HK103_001857 [Boothiomyces macroporosus]|uniref:Uncharacterized protein n=1 Tax=Boothiomyces macroporosus TaxID=261099 RepID=A0AAD5UDP3_9FUNG|nr:hypothetical protein HK103_001857 [Boothiomyces macroporosus]
MLSSLLALISTTIAAPIVGSVSFYEGSCPAPTEGPRFYKTAPGSVITPSNAASVKSLEWEYPSSSFRLSFYVDSHASSPYAVVTGLDHPTFQGKLCGFSEPQGLNVIHLDKTVVGSSKNLFISPDSFVKVETA